MKRTSTLLELFKKSLLFLLSFISVTLLNSESYGQAKSYATVTPSSGLVGYYSVILVGDVVNTDPGADAGAVLNPLGAANGGAGFATLTAKYNNILGIAKGEGEAWIQLKYGAPVAAGKTTYIRFDQPTTGGGLSLDLLGIVGDLTGLLKKNLVQLDVYSGAQAAAGNNENNGTLVNAANVSSAVVKDAAGNTYFAVTPTVGYNSIRVRLRFSGNLLGLALGASINMKVYSAFNVATENCAPSIYATIGESTGVNVTLTELVKTPQLAIDNNMTTAAQLQAGVVGLGSTVSQTIYLNGLSTADDYAKVVISVPASVLNVNLFNTVTVQAYNGNTPVGTAQPVSSLLSVDLLGLLAKTAVTPVYFKPGAPFDRVKVSIDNTLAVGGNILSGGLNIHEVQRTVAKPSFAGLTAGALAICGNQVSLSVNNPDGGFTYNWYKKTGTGTRTLLASGTGPAYSESNIAQGSYTYYLSAQKAGCAGESDVDSAIVNVTATPTVPIVSAPAICSGSPAVLTVTNAAAGHTYRWYTAATGGTAITTGTTFTSAAPLTAGTSYFVEAVNGTCVSAARVEVPVTVNPIPGDAEVSTNSITINAGQTVTLAAVAPTGSVVTWYTVPTGGTAVASGPTYTVGPINITTTFYAGTQSTSGCPSASRVPVTVTVTNPTTGLTCKSANSQESGVNALLCVSCGVNNPIGAIDNDPSTFSTINLAVGIGATGYQRLIFPAAGLATDSIRLELNLPGGLLDATVLGGITVNVMNGNSIVKAYTLSNSLIHLQLLTANRFKATLAATAAYDRVEIRFGGTIQALSSMEIYGAEVIYPNPTVATTGQAICYGTNTTLNATPNGGTTLKWYSAPTGGTLLASGNSFTTTTPLTATTTYYLETSKGSCANADRVPVTVTVNPQIVLPATTLSNATLSATYSKQITPASGGTPVYTYTLTAGSSLPAGLSLSTDGTIGGTPTAAPGDFNFSITATDSKGCSVSTAYTLKLTPAMALPAMTLPNGTVGTTYPVQVIPAATGGTTPYTYTATNLPPGLTFDPATREIKGIPTQKGTYTVHVTATDSNGNNVTQDYTIVVRDPLALANTPLANGTVGSPYPTQTIPAATGGSGSYTYTASGLPPGLTFDAATRQITGTPTQAGTFTVPVQVADTEGNTVTTNYTIAVGNPLLLAAKTLADGTVGTVYATETIPAATGGAGGYVYEGSNLPPGLTFNPATRQISGTPTQSGSYNVGVKVTDANGATASQVYVIKVNGELNLPSATLPNGLVGTVYPTQTLPAVTGGTAPYTYTAIGLPAGLTFTPATREIKGTPLSGGTFTVTMTATDKNGLTTSTDYTLVVNVAAPVVNAVTTCSGTSATLSVANAQSGVTYNWYAATGSTSIFTGTTYTTGPLSANTTFYAEAVSGTAVSSRTPVNVTVNPSPNTATVITANETISSGQSATLLVSADAGNTIKWYTTPTGGASFFSGASYTTPALTATTTYYVETENASGCVSPVRAMVTVTVTNGPANPKCNAAVNQQSGIDGICLLCTVQNPENSTDADPDNFTKINLAVGVASTGYQRLIFAGPGTATDSIRLDLATPVGLADLNVLGNITVTVMNGNTVVGTYPLNSSVLDLKLLNGNRFKATLVAGGVYDRVEIRFGALVAALSNLSIYGAEIIYPNPTVAATGKLICAGSGTTLTATANGGTSLKWYTAASGGTLLATGETLTVAGPLTANTTYYIEVSKAGCANAQRVPVPVTVTTPPDVPVLAATAPVCAGSPAVLAINNPVAGTTYRWYTASTGGTAVFEGPVFTTPALNANTTYFVEAANGNCTSAGRATVAVTVNPLPVLPQVQASSTTVGPGQTAILNASSTETNVIFNWYTSANATTPVYTGPTYVTPPLTVTTTYYLEAVSTTTGCAASSRVQVTINVDGSGPNPVPCEAAITESNGVDGIGLLAGVFNAGLAIDNDTKTSSSLVLPVGLLGGSVYQRVGFNGLSTVGDTVRVQLTAPGKLLSLGLLSGITLTTYNGNTSNNDVLTLSNPLIHLELLGGNTAALISFVPTQAFDKVEVRLNAGIAGVLTSVDLNYAQRVLMAPQVVSADVTACATQTATLQVLNPAAGITYKWFDATGAYLPGKDGPSFVTPALTANTKYYVAASNASGCLSYKTQVNVSVTPVPAVPELESPNVNTCSGSDVILRVKNPLAGITYQWFDSGNTYLAGRDGTSLTITAVTATTTYSVKAVNSCLVPSAAATATINVGSLDAPIVTPPAVTVKVGVAAVLTASSSTAGVIFSWYDAPAGGNLLETGATYIAPAQTVPGTVTYYVEGVAPSGCTTLARTAVTVTTIPNDPPSAVPCEAAVAETHGVNGIGILADVYNPGLAIDDDASTASSLVIPVGVLGAVYQRLGFTGVSNIGDTVRVMLSSPGKILSLAVLPSLDITTYNNGVSNNDATTISSSLIKLELLSGGSKALLTFVPTSKFDAVEVKLNSGILGAFTSIDVNYAQRVIAAPVVQAQTASACQGASATLSVSNPLANVTYKWYQGTVFQADGPTFMTPATLTAGTYDFFVTAARNGCESRRVKVVVTILPLPVPPVADPANPATTCINTPVTLKVTPVTGVVFNWYDQATAGNQLVTNNNSYTSPANLGVGTYDYYVEAVNGNSCTNTARTKVTLIVKPNALPTDILAADQTICSGTTATLTASAPGISGAVFKWYKNPDLSDTPYEGASFTTAALTVTTKYYVIVTGPNICSNDASSAKIVTVTINRNATAADITAADKTICSGTTAALTASSTTVSSPVFRWYKKADLSDVPFVGANFTTDALTATTKYYVTVSGSDACANDAASAKVVTVTVNRNATAADIVAADRTTCSGTAVTLMASSTTVNNPVFSWYRDADLTDLAVRGSSFTTPALTVTTKYYVTVSSAEVCANDALSAKIVTVTVNRNATAADIVLADQTICAGNTATLSASSTTVGSPVFKWYRDASLTDLAYEGPTFTTPALTLTTKYYVTVNGTNACANDVLSAKVVTVTVTRNAVVTDIIADDKTICAGMSAQLSASSPAISNPVFTWYRDAALTDVAFIGANVTATGLTSTTRYYVTVSGTGVCANLPGSAKVVTVTVNPVPNVPIVGAGGTAICSGDGTTLTIQNPQTGVNYEWYTAATNGTLVNTGITFNITTLNATTDYYVQATSALGCGTATGRVKVTVTVTPKPVPPSVVSGIVNTCIGSTAVLSVSNPVTGVTYNWYATATSTTILGSGANFTTPQLNTPSTTFYVGASSGSCISTSRTPVVVNAGAIPNPPPSVSGAENPFCPGSTPVLRVNNPDATLKYAWYTVQVGGTALAEGNTFNVPALTGTTIYYVGSINLATGCASATRTAVTVTVLARLAAPVVSVQEATATSITFAWNAVPGATAYEVSTDAGLTWVSPSSGPVGTTHLISGLQPNQNVNIRVRAKGQLDCQLSDATSLNGTSDNPLGNGIFVPNTFTPNNDGKNDVLYVYGNTIAKMRLRVYNQWGQFLYESLSIQNGWDGTYKGQMQPNGVYVYYLEAEFNDGSKATKKGTITLLR
ncbi:putative Ig domain-containing protein [Pedobacter heparinus]|uniref:Ig family protein n=1 Tax=Pedobacter heparinus (strain ATCC 13125 / DSM 2366 / CIP 104194 / JCM 7457 / NBRC 12017 / NCIMB 9290 / NRRL B-14731 / HIM 762-3) TaxID=485917 RepID=C6XUE4_PEDHD|nr:putative Ig domain-containing protein [Pedobacter heparinus]ACU05937.1 Ig family protein [Pedobacter heparinus DSM 2366]